MAQLNDERLLAELNALGTRFPTNPITFELTENQQLKVIGKGPLKGPHLMKQRVSEQLRMKFMDSLTQVEKLNLMATCLNQVKALASTDWKQETQLLALAGWLPPELQEDFKVEAQEKLEQDIRTHVSPLREKVKNYPGKKSYLKSAWSLYAAGKPICQDLNLGTYQNSLKVTAGASQLHLSTFFEETIVTSNLDIKTQVKTSRLELLNQTRAVMDEALNVIYLMEQAEDYVARRKQSLMSKLSKKQKREFQDAFKEGALFQERSYQLDAKTKCVIGNLEAGIEGFSPILEQAIQSIHASFLAKFLAKEKKEKKQLATLMQNAIPSFLLKVIDESPKKGTQTYVEILKGSKNKKMSDYNYQALASYGALADVQTAEILHNLTALIVDGLIEKRQFKATFGTYEGLILSEKGREAIGLGQQLKLPTIKRVSDFISGMTQYKTEAEREGLIQQLASVSLDKAEDVATLIEFVVHQRSCYSKSQSLFFEVLTQIIDSKYTPLILLNANLVTGGMRTRLLDLHKRFN